MSKPRFRPRPDVAERRARVLALRIEQTPYSQIAAELGIGLSTAKMDYVRAGEALKAEQDANAHLLRVTELAKLDAGEREAWRMLRKDDDLVLAALDRLLRIAARRATLTGLDAPAKIEVSDGARAEIRRLAAELGAVEPGGDADAPGDASGDGTPPPPAA